MNQLKEQQKLIRELSKQYLALYPVLGEKEAVTVPSPTGQITLPETSTNLSGGVEAYTPGSGEIKAHGWTPCEMVRSPVPLSPSPDSRSSDRPAQSPSTRPCAECTEETLVSDLTDNGHGFKVCPKCFVPDEEEQEDDLFMKRAYDAHNDRWIYE